MNKGPEVKETAFLYFHISLFACSHNMCSPASDENPLHSDTCDREANNQICGKYRRTVSFTSCFTGSSEKNTRNQNDIDKTQISAFTNIFLVALLIIVEKSIT